MLNGHKLRILFMCTLAFFASASACVAILNLMNDSTGISKIYYDVEARLADALQSSTPLVGQSRKAVVKMDERVFRMLWYKKRQVDEPLVIFGSSRVRMLNNDFLGLNGKVFTEAVNGATLQDFVTFLYAKKFPSQFRPEKIIIGVEPYMLSTTNGYKNVTEYIYPKSYGRAVETYKLTNIPAINTDLETNFEAEYLSGEQVDSFTLPGLSSIRDALGRIQKYNLKPLFSLNSFEDNLNYIITSVTLGYVKFSSLDFFSGNREIIHLHGECSEAYFKKHITTKHRNHFLWCYDGSSPGYNEIPEADIETIQKLVMKDPGMPLVPKIDKDAVNLLRQIVRLLRNEGVNVEFLMQPAHPLFYAQSRDNQDKYGYVKVEKFLKQFSAKNKVGLHGSYKVVDPGARISCYRDWIHPATCALAPTKKSILGMLNNKILQ